MLELEEAALSSHCYQLVSNQSQRSVCETAEQQSYRTEIHDRVIKGVILRHWEASDGRIDEAIQSVRSTIQFRIEEQVNELRDAMLQSKFGKLPTACVELLNTTLLLSGRDFEGRANIKIHPYFAASRQNSKGSVEASICMIESAITASECRKADTIIVSIDFVWRLDFSFRFLVLLYE